MGFNSSLILLNDALHYIEKDPYFGEKIADAIARLSVEAHCNAATVIETHHANYTTVIAFGGNEGRLLHWGDSSEENRKLLASIADYLGFRLVQKSRKK